MIISLEIIVIYSFQENFIYCICDLTFYFPRELSVEAQLEKLANESFPNPSLQSPLLWAPDVTSSVHLSCLSAQRCEELSRGRKAVLDIVSLSTWCQAAGRSKG